jgi:hypothetical protein
MRMSLEARRRMTTLEEALNEAEKALKLCKERVEAVNTMNPADSRTGILAREDLRNIDSALRSIKEARYGK